mmetsp:Transcript_37627/g.89028  ORF Transcript_37627/g.89028 Transcript_37627/m.89028 type:complete len:342 (+) Transcript_37627:152-1177(+)
MVFRRACAAARRLLPPVPCDVLGGLFSRELPCPPALHRKVRRFCLLAHPVAIEIILRLGSRELPLGLGLLGGEGRVLRRGAALHFRAFAVEPIHQVLDAPRCSAGVRLRLVLGRARPGRRRNLVIEVVEVRGGLLRRKVLVVLPHRVRVVRHPGSHREHLLQLVLELLNLREHLPANPPVPRHSHRLTRPIRLRHTTVVGRGHERLRREPLLEEVCVPPARLILGAELRVGARPARPRARVHRRGSVPVAPEVAVAADCVFHAGVAERPAPVGVVPAPPVLAVAPVTVPIVSVVAHLGVVRLRRRRHRCVPGRRQRLLLFFHRILHERFQVLLGDPRPVGC